MAFQSSGNPGADAIVSTAIIGGLCIYAITELVHIVQAQVQSWTVLEARIGPRSARDWNHLSRKLGLDVNTIGNNLESCKEAAGVPPFGDARIDDETGDIYYNGEYIGNVLDGC